MHNPSKNNQPQFNKGKTNRIRCRPWVIQEYGRKEWKRKAWITHFSVSLRGPWSPSTSADHYLHLLHWENKDQAMGASFTLLPFFLKSLRSLKRKGLLVQIRLLIYVWYHFPHSSFDQGLNPQIGHVPLTGNRTSDLLVQRRTRSHISQGPSTMFSLAWLLFDLQMCSIFSIPVLVSHLFFFLYYQAVAFKSGLAPSTLLKWFS